MVGGGSVNHRGGVDKGGSGVMGHGSSVVGDRGILGLSRVGHISNVSAVGVGNVVVDMLDPAVGQVDGVGAGGGVAVTVLLGVEPGARVVVGNGVVVGVDGGLLIGGLLVGGGSLVDGSGLVGGGSGLVDRGSGLVGGGGDTIPGGVIGSGDSGKGEDSKNLNIKITAEWITETFLPKKQVKKI